jgi:glycerol-3-phosphate dehydrogenase
MLESAGITSGANLAYDIAVIGGGINGVGIARDAAGRGLRVLLVEQHDLASHTSSASTKLIHGGLRYLENCDFRLVREALAERERLLASAPHIIRPLRFVLPHDPAIRPAWLIRLGLMVYDRLAPRRDLPGSKAISLAHDPVGRALKPAYAKAFVYSDCWVDDSRLAAVVAVDAAERDATVLTRTKTVAAVRKYGHWELALRNQDTGAATHVRAKAIVNAAGPWVADVLRNLLHLKTERRVRLVKGSHIVVPALYDGEHAFMVQNEDGRIVFALPYEGRFTLIGSTDVPFEGDPSRVEASQAEIAYLCRCVSRYFRQPVSPGDVVWRYAGVRPLFDDGASDPTAVTRDYVFDLDASAGQAPALSIFGGKITTFRRLAEQALEALRPYFPRMGPPWTAKAKLPGGGFEHGDFAAFATSVRERWPFLKTATAERLARAYGTRVERILGSARCAADLGSDFGCGLTEAELDYLARDEWARTADDVLWRRSKLGLHLSKAQVEEVAMYHISSSRNGARAVSGIVKHGLS